MAPPLVTIYVTSLTSAPKVRKHTELLHRALRGLEIPYETYDLVNDEDAKRRWQRAKPEGMVVGLPGYLVGGEWIGTMDDFEEAVETQTLESFLKQDQDLVADASQTIGEAELDRLMREMTDEDLDQLVGHLSVDDSTAPAASVAKAAAGGPVAGTAPVSTSVPAAAAAEATDKPPSSAMPIPGAKDGERTPKEEKTFSAYPEQARSPTSGGILAAASAAVASAVHKAEDVLKHAVEEPASVTAKRDEAAAEARSPKPASPVAELHEAKTLDDLIDRTLAKEAVEEEEKEHAKEAEKEEAKADIKAKVDALKKSPTEDKGKEKAQ